MDKKEREKMYSYRPTDTQTNPPHTHIIYEQKTQKYGHTKFQKTMKPGAGAGASAESILVTLSCGKIRPFRGHTI
jgi:hypothetical protein